MEGDAVNHNEGNPTPTKVLPDDGFGGVVAMLVDVAIDEVNKVPQEPEHVEDLERNTESGYRFTTMDENQLGEVAEGPAEEIAPAHDLGQKF